MSIIAQTSSITTNIASNSSWLIDTRASSHMTRNESLFSLLETSIHLPIVVANGSSSLASGVRMVHSSTLPIECILFVLTFWLIYYVSVKSPNILIIV